jgi:hypothetical protein
MTIIPPGYRRVQTGRFTRDDDLVLVLSKLKWQRLDKAPDVRAVHVHARLKPNDWIVIRKIGRDTQRHAAIAKVIADLRTGRIKL